MIEQIDNSLTEFPFLYQEDESVLISDSAIVLDLFFLEQFNALVLKKFPCFIKEEIKPVQSYVEINDEKELDKLDDFFFSNELKEVLWELLKGLSTTLIGVQITKPEREMCPSVHVDKLPLRLVQCLDGEGTTLVTPSGKEIKTEKGDLILLKGEMWKSYPGAIKHKSPQTDNFRTLLRIDFLD